MSNQHVGKISFFLITKKYSAWFQSLKLILMCILIYVEFLYMYIRNALELNFRYETIKERISNDTNFYTHVGTVSDYELCN